MVRCSLVAMASALLLASPSQAGVDEGGALYREQCAQCHGDTGMGDGPTAVVLQLDARNFTTGPFLFDTDDDGRTGTVQDFIAVIRQGSVAFGGAPGMAARAFLSDQELSDLAAFLVLEFHPCPLCALNLSAAGKEKLKINRNGRVRRSVEWEFSFDEEGFEAMDDGDVVTTGTYEPVGDSGRRWMLVFDEGSLDTLLDSALELAPELVDDVEGVVERDVAEATLKVNAAFTRARIEFARKVRVLFGGEGRAGRHSLNLKAPQGPRE